MKEMEFSVQDIKELMESMRRNKITELQVGKGDYTLKLETAGETVVTQAAAPAATAAIERPVAGEGQEERSGNLVKSPIVGTFYAAPAPDKEPYVQVGSQVKKGDVLFIIESMKLMNEVTSDFTGTVTEIVTRDGQGVEYGQPILYIE